MTGCEPTWRGFVRALADEIDEVGGATARDALLRGVGRRMAASNPLTTTLDVAGLELEINDHLAGWGWGRATLRLDAAQRSLTIEHAGLPVVGSAGDPPGTWVSAVLEGLYEAWLNALPGADRSLAARRVKMAAESVSLRYGRA
jgi:hypothetical protein